MILTQHYMFRFLRKKSCPQHNLIWTLNDQNLYSIMFHLLDRYCINTGMFNYGQIGASRKKSSLQVHTFSTSIPFNQTEKYIR